MIKFFRKIRYDLMSKNKKGNYFKYAIGEILLVVIGILIALSINNWNTERLNNNRNSQLLVKLSKELDLNIERSAYLYSIFDGGFSDRYKYTDSLLKILDKGIHTKDLDYMVSDNIFYVNTFNLNTSVFEELKNTGSLYALGSDSLVTSIQLYYQLCDRESFYNLRYSEVATNRKEKCYEGWFDFKYSYKLNPEKAIKNHNWIFNPQSSNYIYFRQYVTNVKDHSSLMSRKLKGIIAESQKLKALISEEKKK